MTRITHPMSNVTVIPVFVKKKKRETKCITLFGVVPPVLCFWSMELNPWKMISAQFDVGMCVGTINNLEST